MVKPEKGCYDESEFKVGEQVYVKPGGARCTAQWQRGVVSRVNSGTSVDVDGIPRHIADLRHVSPSDDLQRLERPQSRKMSW